MTRNKLYSSILLLLLVPFAIRAQVDITRDAYSVVQNATTEIICESATSALQKESYTITILNEKDETLHTSFVCVTSFVLCGNSPERLQTRPARSSAKLRNRIYK